MLLTITNGESAVHTLEAAGVKGDVLAWQDVLHEGPVPGDLTLSELSRQRAHFISRWYGTDFASTLATFQVRDRHLIGSADYDEVLLWFEHDLYDQLQLLQLLSWFSNHRPGGTRLSMICTGSFVATTPAPRLQRLYQTRGAVSEEQLACGRRGWAAFRAPSPVALQGYLAEDTASLPYVRPALLRLCHEYPALRSGLSRSQRQILQLLRSGVRRPVPLFRKALAMEEAAYLGDATFWNYLAGMSNVPRPLVRVGDQERFLAPRDCGSVAQFKAQTLRLTPDGEQVLDGSLDWLALNGIDRWLGGVHLTSDNVWRWDPRRSRMIRTPS